MKRALLRTVLRWEVVGIARVMVIVLTVFLLLLELGIRTDLAMDSRIDQLGYGLVGAAAFVMLGSLLRTTLRGVRLRKAVLLWFVTALFLLIERPLGVLEWTREESWPYLVFLSLFAFIEISRLEIGRNARLFNPALLLVASFALIIAMGTALFLMPNAAHRPLTLVEALFTATSATCVTGLSVIDVSSELTRTGQWILMLLAQVGGLGVMTFTSFFAFFFKGRTSLEEQLRIRDIANTTLGSAKQFVIRVVLFTLTVEAIGAAFVYFSVAPSLFPNEGEHVFFAVFHSISAFNNAGFSTVQNGMLSEQLVFNYPLMWVLSLIIIFGGLGFGITFNFATYLRYWVGDHLRKWLFGVPRGRHPRLITGTGQMVLATTVMLLVLGCAVMAVLDWDKPDLARHGAFGKVSVMFFTSAASRTAGFNAVDFNLMSLPTLGVVLLLMYVGGSPGSTAGGIKTTTFALAILNIFATARGRRSVEFAGREISQLTIRRAFATIMLSLLMLGISITLVSSLEPAAPLVQVIFECFSAFATVGQSMGITPHLGEPARLVIVATMFVGRVSALAILVGVLRQVHAAPYRYPQEDILIN